MNREQAIAAIVGLYPDDPEGIAEIDLDDIQGSIGECIEAIDRLSGAERECALKLLAILRQHRDYLQTEDAALAVWREVFVGQAIRVDGWGKLSGAASIADEAETQFRRRLADHMKAKG